LNRYQSEGTKEGVLTMPATKTAEADMQRIVELALEAALGEQSVFDGSIGVDENCFSANQILKVLLEGADEKEIEHLARCRVCSQNIGALSSVNLKSPPHFVANAVRLSKSSGARQSQTERQSRTCAAVIAFGGELAISSKPEDKFELTVKILPVCFAEHASELDLNSIRASGAVISGKPTLLKVDRNESGTIKLVDLVFRDAKLSSRVRDGIVHGQRVVDYVQIEGFLGHSRFVGQGRLSVIPQALVSSVRR
jgi:hypothetical protein